MKILILLCIIISSVVGCQESSFQDVMNKREKFIFFCLEKDNHTECAKAASIAFPTPDEVKCNK